VAEDYATLLVDLAEAAGGGVTDPGITVTDCADHEDNRILELGLESEAVLIPAGLAAELASHVEAVREGTGDEGLLFPGANGNLAERRQFLGTWHRAASAAGWPMHTPTRAVWHPHDFRHVAACWMPCRTDAGPRQRRVHPVPLRRRPQRR